MPINAGILSNSIENAQKNIEDGNFERRKNVIRYDDVMNEQRRIIYDQRRQVLDGEDMNATIREMAESSIRESCGFYLAGDRAEWNTEAIRQQYFGVLPLSDDFFDTKESAEEATDALVEMAFACLNEKEALFGETVFREVERTILLRSVDTKWIDHLDAMEDLRGAISLNAYAQRNPVFEYKIQGTDMFEEMVDDIREDTVRKLLTVMPREKAVERTAVAKVTSEGFAGGEKPVAKKPVKVVKIGRNEPCPCGSGKKYKKCCGINEAAGND